MEIKLSNGKIALIDDDCVHITTKKWQQIKGGYAKTDIWDPVLKKSRGHLMHKLILDVPKGMSIDHINGNPLDNRRSNLRICSHSDNMLNRGIQKNNTSGYPGVCFNRRNKKWLARINAKRQAIHIGYFDKLDIAIEARKKAEEKYFGEYRRL